MGMAFWRIIVILWSKRFMHQSAADEEESVGLVFGAGLEKNGTPSLVLRERVDAATDLYHQGIIREMIMSGGNRSLYCNEPLAMKLQALAQNVPEGKIHLDHDGFRSFDSCVHLKQQEPTRFLLITQSFHLPRVLLIAKGIGINAIGYAASHQVHHPLDMLWWHVREIPATARALIDIISWQIFRQ
jgi:vancomycin permeability regulator SanA